MGKPFRLCLTIFVDLNENFQGLIRHHFHLQLLPTHVALLTHVLSVPAHSTCMLCAACVACYFPFGLLQSVKKDISPEIVQDLVDNPGPVQGGIKMLMSAAWN